MRLIKILNPGHYSSRSRIILFLYYTITMGSVKYKYRTGHDSSYADAKHDFVGIFDAKRIVELTKQTLPKKPIGDTRILSEDAMIEKYLLKSEFVKKPDSTGADRLNDYFDNLSTDITDRYECINISREQHDFTLEYSEIQKALQLAGVIDDVFFVCDVAYANIRQDLKFSNKSLGQTFYWVQNAQTLYDPAGKTSWHTDDNTYNPDNSTKTKIYPNYFKKNDSNFIFCWQDAIKERFTLYPEWERTCDEVDSKLQTEKMVCSNRNIFLGIKSDNVKDYHTHEAYLIVTEPTKPGYYSYSNKVLSAKGNGILNKSEIVSYRARGNDLKTFAYLINAFLKGSNSNVASVKLREIEDYSSEIQVLAKKLGDASQSLSCCLPVFNLQRFKTQNLGYSNSNVEDFQSNGNHAFVSYDRIAIVCAINYDSPIVIYNTLKGFLMFIRRDLISKEGQIDSIKLSFSMGIDELYQKLTEKIYNLKTMVMNLNAKMRIILTFLANIHSNTDTVTTNTHYQNILLAYFSHADSLKMFLNIDKDVLLGVFHENYPINDDILNKFKDDLNTASTDYAGKSRNKKIDEILKTFQKLKNTYQKISVFSKYIDSNSESINYILNKPSIDLEAVQSPQTADYAETFSKIIPKGIIDNINKLLPFGAKEFNPRIKNNDNNNVFLDKGTQLYGTTNTILPLYEVLNDLRLHSLKKNFVKFVNDVISLRVEDGVAIAVKEQLHVMLTTHNNTESYYRGHEDVIGTIMTHETSNTEPIIKTDLRTTENPEQYIGATFSNFFDGEEYIGEIISYVIDNYESGNNYRVFYSIKYQDGDKEELFLDDFKNKIIAPQKGGGLTLVGGGKLNELALNMNILNRKHLLIPKQKITSDKSELSFRDRIKLIKDSDKTVKEVLKKYISSEDLDTTLKDKLQVLISNSYKNDVFIKGFAALYMFMKMKGIINQGNISETIENDSLKKIPKIFRNEKNSNVISRLYELCNIKLDEENSGKMVTDEEENSEKMVTDEEENSEKMVTDEEDEEQNEGSSFTTNSLINLLEMNTVFVDNKQVLVGAFKGIKTNRINTNIALLYFMENKMSVMNKEALPHPELVGLFNELFKETGILPNEMVKANEIANANETTEVGKSRKRGMDDEPEIQVHDTRPSIKKRYFNQSAGNDQQMDTGENEDDDDQYYLNDDKEGTMLSELHELMVSDSATSKREFEKYRINSYLLLNMPTRSEISEIADPIKSEEFYNNYGSKGNPIREHIYDLMQSTIQSLINDAKTTNNMVAPIIDTHVNHQMNTVKTGAGAAAERKQLSKRKKKNNNNKTFKKKPKSKKQKTKKRSTSTNKNKKTKKKYNM
jgi:hypothetical protein